MKLRQNVQSSNVIFKPLEVNVDTVFYRFNERKWVEDDVHIGWIYDEIWYEKDIYIEKISKENEELSAAIMELTLKNFDANNEMQDAIMQLTNLLGGM